MFELRKLLTSRNKQYLVNLLAVVNNPGSATYPVVWREFRSRFPGNEVVAEQEGKERLWRLQRLLEAYIAAGG